MKMEFHFWFPFIYFCILIFHLLGFDQQYILLNLASPLRWYEMTTTGIGFSTVEIYLYDLLIWCVIGWIIDGFIWFLTGKRKPE